MVEVIVNLNIQITYRVYKINFGVIKGNTFDVNRDINVVKGYGIIF